MKNTRAVLSLFLVAFIWGSGFIMTQMALDAGYTWSFTLFFRFLIAALLFGGLFAKKIRGIGRADLKGGLISGGLLFLSFTFQTLGLQYTTPSNNAFFTATNTVIVPFLVWIFFKSRPELKTFLAGFVCFLGVFVISYNPEKLSFWGLGELLSLLGAAAFAAHTVSLGYFSRKTTTEKLVFLQFATAAAASLVAFLLIDRDFTHFIPRPEMLSVLYLAVFSTCVAYFIQTGAQSKVPPTTVSLIISTESIFASALSVALKYDKLAWTLVAGGGLILLSIVIVEMKLGRQKKEA